MPLNRHRSPQPNDRAQRVSERGSGISLTLHVARSFQFFQRDDFQYLLSAPLRHDLIVNFTVYQPAFLLHFLPPLGIT
ncbi:hypothetical protein FHR07_26150 [Serratia ureilytica]|nr:hypothetical protein [Serratia ureilytica]